MGKYNIIKDDIKKFLKSYLNYLTNSKNDFSTVSFWKTDDNKIVKLKYDKNLIDKLISDILINQLFRGKLTSYDAEYIIKGGLVAWHTKLDNSKRKYDEEFFIENGADYILNKLSKIKLEEYTCIIPISGINLYKSDIIKTSFINIYSKDYKKDDIIKYSKPFIIIHSGTSDQEIKKLANEHKWYLIQKELDSVSVDSNFLKFQIHSGTIDGAKELSIIIGNSFINTVRIFSNRLSYNGINIMLGNHKDKLLNIDSFITKNDNTIATPYSSEENENVFPISLIIDKYQNGKQLKKIFIDNMNIVFEKISRCENLNSFEQIMFNTNNLIGEGLVSSSIELKITNFMSAIENLLEYDDSDKNLYNKLKKLKKLNNGTNENFDEILKLISDIKIGKSITEQLANRVTSMLINTDADVESFRRHKKVVKSLYNKRSRISHGGSNVIISQMDVDTLKDISINLFHLILLNFEEINSQVNNNKTILKNWIDNYIKNRFKLSDDELDKYI